MNLNNNSIKLNLKHEELLESTLLVVVPNESFHSETEYSGV